MWAPRSGGRLCLSLARSLRGTVMEDAENSRSLGRTGVDVLYFVNSGSVSMASWCASKWPKTNYTRVPLPMARTSASIFSCIGFHDVTIHLEVIHRARSTPC